MAKKSLFQIYVESNRPGRTRVPQDFSGVRVGTLTVIDYSHRASSGVLRWRCRCDCGAEKLVESTQLKIGRPKSCGADVHSPAHSKDRVFERFLSHLIRRDDGECWGWRGAKNFQGYGMLGVKINGETRSIGAHRLSHEYFTGPVPDGLKVLHSCDNPICTNPKHLRIGTQQDNMNDMSSRARGARKLNVKDVVGIKKHLSKPHARGLVAALARKHEVSIDMICKIRDGKNWKFVPWPRSSIRTK